nr:hypothetical protein [uncultured Oscillibacter sp.]
MEYNGNAVYSYIVENELENYYFPAENTWILLYGDAYSNPRILVLALRAEALQEPFSKEEKTAVRAAVDVSKELGLPFIGVRFVPGSDQVLVWETTEKKPERMSYDELRDLYEEYGVVQPGTPRKSVNQYVSSSYHTWQRANLGKITVSDLDLLRYGEEGELRKIIELKRSKYAIDRWKPFDTDFPNFALVINAIVDSGRNIPFQIYYNVLRDGPKGRREDDISQIKVFAFDIPEETIDSMGVKYKDCGVFQLDELLKD